MNIIIQIIFLCVIKVNEYPDNRYIYIIKVDEYHYPDNIFMYNQS